VLAVFGAFDLFYTLGTKSPFLSFTPAGLISLWRLPPRFFSFGFGAKPSKFFYCGAADAVGTKFLPLDACFLMGIMIAGWRASSTSALLISISLSIMACSSS
jgi:hypothetical protein